MLIGSQVGTYRILGKLGEGGMGVVWRAHDTKLGRDVALKTVSAALAAEPGVLKRLAGEAALLASLNHPNIAAIYGLEEVDGNTCLVLELVEGETLEQVLRRGPLPVPRALALAAQLASGVAAAHDRGVVHRDLKPANVKITPDDRVKVLDFGIGKMLAPVTEASNTVTAEHTAPGTMLGTPGYMSPEQARGEAVDGQSDIWAFGLVLYEMLTGVAAFRRPTAAETIASLLEREPDFAALPPATPPAVRRLIRRCLQKPRRSRLRHMADVQLTLEDAIAEPEAPRAEARRAVPGRWLSAAAVAAALALVGMGWGLGRVRPVERTASAVRLTMKFPASPTVLPLGNRAVAISHDGTRVAFTGGGRLWLRRMDQAEPVAVQVISEASNPVFSPDDQWIALFSYNALEKVPVAGGPPVTVATVTDRKFGLDWSADDVIVFATSEGLFRVPAGGGNAQLLAKPNRDIGEVLYAWPQLLPGRRAVLLTIVSDRPQRTMRTALFDLDTQTHTIVLEDASSATYTTTGHLVYASGPNFRSVEFDAKSGKTRGEPVTHAAITLGGASENGVANYAVADDGTLVFFPRIDGNPLAQLTWVDRQGREEPLAIAPQRDRYARISPDGNRIAVDRSRGGKRDIWIITLDRLTETQLTDGPTEDLLPIWSPDGARVWFASDRGGNFDVYSQAADGAGPARLELAAPEVQMTGAFTPDGRGLLVYDRYRDTMLLPLSPKGELQPLLANERFDERLAQVSPDGRWIAYESDESGDQFEIMVRPFPDVNARRDKASQNGGRFPQWSSSGDELFYVDPDGAMMAVPVTHAPSLVLGAAKKLFQWRKPGGRSGIPYDVSPKDGRFLFPKLITEGNSTGTDVSVILHWSPAGR